MPARNGSTGRTGRRDGGPSAPAARRPGPGAAEIAGGADGLVVGAVPVAARLTGAWLVLAGIAGLVAPFPTYLVVGGEELTLATGATGLVAALIVPLASAAVGLLLLLAAVPKFGLAYAAVAGSLAVGQLLIELYRGDSSTVRPGVEVLAGDLVVTSSVSVGAGWVLSVVALGLLVLAGVFAVAAWGRTVMDDDGRVDGLRPALAGIAVLLGVTAVLSLALPAADVPDLLVTDPSTGLQTVVTREGPQALLERPGLALLGGLLLGGALVLCAVVAPSLRPRLAAVGGLLALAVTVLAAGTAGLRDALASADLSWTLPGAGLLTAGAGLAVLTAVAWRARRHLPPEDLRTRE